MLWSVSLRCISLPGRICADASLFFFEALDRNMVSIGSGIGCNC